MTQSGYQFITCISNSDFAQFNIGLDGISIWFLVLTTFLIPICILASWDNINQNLKSYYSALLLIESLLIGVWIVLDLLYFYFFFEAVLIPLFLIVGIWGSGNLRIRSAFLLFLYTLLGSLFILLIIVLINTQLGSTDYRILISVMSTIDNQIQCYLWLGFFIAFAIKTPLVPFHIWLPFAHSNSSLTVSILLAGIILKLATYGYLRILIPIFPYATQYYIPLVQTLAIVSLIYASLVTIRQSDLKGLIAYSSIGHIAVTVLGLFSNTLVGIQGGYLLSIAHGLVSPALFILVGGVLYDRYHTRVIPYYRGLFLTIPLFSTLFFVATCCNIAVPLSLNWISEVISLAGIFQQSPLIGILGSTGILLSACYSIWLWSRIVGGNYSSHLKWTIDVTRREFWVVLTLLSQTIYLGIQPNWIVNTLIIPISEIVSVEVGLLIKYHSFEKNL